MATPDPHDPKHRDRRPPLLRGGEDPAPVDPPTALDTAPDADEPLAPRGGGGDPDAAPDRDATDPTPMDDEGRNDPPDGPRRP
jgi:hypothetical protein